MPAVNRFAHYQIEQRRRLAIRILAIVWLFALLALDLKTDVPFTYTTIAWFVYAAVVLLAIFERKK
jgi:hypothetical protein